MSRCRPAPDLMIMTIITIVMKHTSYQRVFDLVLTNYGSPTNDGAVFMQTSDVGARLIKT